MFIRKNPRKNHVYYNVVKGVREEGAVKQEQVLYIGRVDNMTPERRREVEAKLRELEDGAELLRDFRTLLIEHDYDFFGDPAFGEGHSLDEIDVKNALDYGPVRALHAMAEKMDLGALLEAHMEPKGAGPSLSKLHLVLIISRCLEPRSLSKTVDWYRLTALPELLDLPVGEVTYDALRNSLDYVPRDGIEQVHEALWTRTRELYDTPDSPLQYDLTSSYFEGTEVPIAEYGYSRDHRPDRKQILVGVTVNPDMVPLHHDVYPGNRNDSPTVKGVVERLVELDVADPLIVGDKMVLTAPNRKGLRGDDEWDIEPIDYVAAMKNTQPIKDVLKAISLEAFEPVALEEGADPLAVTEIDPDEYVAEDEAPEYLPDARIRWIVAYSESKAADDAEARQEKLEEILEKLDALAEVQFDDDPLEKQELLEKVDRAVTNAFDEIVEWSVNERGPPRLTFGVDEEALAEAATLDGKALFETTRGADRLSPASVGLAYRNRDSVEKFIQSIKDISELRPFYVRIEQKIRALVFFCVLGIHLMALLQLELDEAGIEMTGLKALEKLRGIRRVEMAVDGEEAAVVKTTELSEGQEELMFLLD